MIRLNSGLMLERKICHSPAPPSPTRSLSWVGFTHIFEHTKTHVFNIKFLNYNKRHMLAPSQQAVIKRNSFGGGHFVWHFVRVMRVGYVFVYTQIRKKKIEERESESARERERGKRSENKCVQSNTIDKTRVPISPPGNGLMVKTNIQKEINRKDNQFLLNNFR